MREAYRWLAEADLDNPARDAIARQLESMLAKQQLARPAHSPFFEAYFRWATTDNVPTIAAIVAHRDFGTNQQLRPLLAVEALGRLKDPRAVDALLICAAWKAREGDAAKKALQAIGPAGHSALIKHTNDLSFPLRQDGRARSSRSKARTSMR